MHLTFALIAYASAMTVANLIVSHFVATAPQLLPLVTGMNAFFLIGLDLAMRDWLHVRLKAAQMLALIAGSGLLTYGLNPAAGQIAVASACAFTLAAVADWSAFSAVAGSWLKRANVSNVAGAAVDSLAFSALAPFPFMWPVVCTQFVAKVAGGAVWSFILNRIQGVRA